ncbi:MAG TPA: MFS transporter [Streptosporangiaceae bacterium]|nr:MFS transporter [Streptosporangiaceae bacterium]
MSITARAGAAWRSGPLSDRSFRLLASGQFTSTVGDYCYAVALPWLVLSAHGGTILLGTVLACYGLPRTVLIPVGGLLTDKIGPRAIMLAADATRCGLVIVLVALAAGHVVALALLGPVAALLGAGEGLFIPASFSIMPSLLEPGHLAAGNAVNSAAVQAGSVAGPVLGGLLVATAGPAPAFAVDAATFAVSALSLALIRLRPSAAAPGGSAGPVHAGAAGQSRDTSAGGGVWSLLRRSRLFRVIVVNVIAANLVFGGTFEVALPALAHARFGAGGYGALIACLGAGAVIGTLAAARGGDAGRPALVASGSFLAEAVAVGLIPFLGGLPGAAAAIFVLGACNGMGNVVFLTLVQRWAPPRLIGRVMSVIMLAGLGSFPLSAAVSGVLVHRLGPSVFFPVAAATVTISILGAMSQPEFRDFGSTESPEAELGAESA